LGGGASQFSIADGNPPADVSQADLGVFALDGWRDFAPRLGIAWAPEGTAGKPLSTYLLDARLRAPMTINTALSSRWVPWNPR